MIQIFKPNRDNLNTSLSISISMFMNWYNKKMAIKEK